MRCTAVRSNGERCNAAAKTGFEMCNVHLILQERAKQEKIEKGESLLPHSELPEIDDSVLEQATRNLGGTAMTVINKEKFPNLSFKFVRDTSLAKRRAVSKGWQLLKAGDGDLRPVVGQNENVWAEFKDQVGEDGYIHCGDTIIAVKDRRVHQAEKKIAEAESSRLVNRMFKSDKDLEEASDPLGRYHFFRERPTVVRGGRQLFPRPPQKSTKTSVFIQNNPLAK